MFAVRPLSSLKSDISGAAFWRLLAVEVQRARILGRWGKVNECLTKAVISSGDKTLEAERKDPNKSVPHSGSDTSSAAFSLGKIELRAVLTVRKKMRQRLVDRMEDQLESFMNGIDQGIKLQLVSEEVDPGQCPATSALKEQSKNNSSSFWVFLNSSIASTFCIASLV